MTWDIDDEFEQEQATARTLRRRASRRFVARLLLVIVCLSLVSWYSYRILVPQPSLSVRAGEATLRIPIENRAVWDWNSVVAQPTLEYGWNVTIPGIAHRYMLGYMLFNDGKQSAQSGSLDKLLQFGQPLLQREVDSNSFFVEDVPLTYSLEYDTLVIRIQDAATVERIFANRPLTATLEVTTPYKSPIQSDIAITYQP